MVKIILGAIADAAIALQSDDSLSKLLDRARRIERRYAAIMTRANNIARNDSLMLIGPNARELILTVRHMATHTPLAALKTVEDAVERFATKEELNDLRPTNTR